MGGYSTAIYHADKVLLPDIELECGTGALKRAADPEPARPTDWSVCSYIVYVKSARVVLMLCSSGMESDYVQMRSHIRSE